MTIGISSKDLQKVRRNAERKRTSVACARCKMGKSKCSDYRPCKKCKLSNLAGGCVDVVLSMPQSADTLSSSAPSDPEWSKDITPFVEQARICPGQVINGSYSAQLQGPSVDREFPVPCSTRHPSFCLPASGAGIPMNGAPDQNYMIARNSADSIPRSGRPILMNAADPGLIQTHRFLPALNLIPLQMQYSPRPLDGPTPTLPRVLPPILSLPHMAPQTLLPPAVAALMSCRAAAAAPLLTAPSTDGNLLLLALLNRLQHANAVPNPHRLAPVAPPPPLLPVWGLFPAVTSERK